MKNNAALYDPRMLIEAGIDPKTGLPLAMGEVCSTKGDIKKQLRIVDEQDAVNRFTWYNLPKGLNANLIERILYYRGQGMLFFLKDKFYFLPYALDGTIDVYGRYTSVTPLPFNGTANDGKEAKPWIQGLSFAPVYDVMLPEELTSETEARDILENSCVLLYDYTQQISQKNISRQILNDPLLDLMSVCLPYMRTALLNGTGVRGLRVGSDTESASVYAANNAIDLSAQTGRQLVPIVGELDFQDLTNGTTMGAEEFLLAMQSMDNYRLSLYGLDNGGLFQKRSHMLEAEQETNAGNVGLIMRDSLWQRQNFCNIVNSIWGTMIWCEPSETAIGVDMGGDGVANDSEAAMNEGNTAGGTANEGGNDDAM